MAGKNKIKPLIFIYIGTRSEFQKRSFWDAEHEESHQELVHRPLLYTALGRQVVEDLREPWRHF